MKIGVLSDIHGNSFALKEVLEIAKIEQVQKLFILGDYVGYYYHPDLVLEMLSKWESLYIQGNHEKILYDLKEKKIDNKELRNKYGSGHDIALKKLSSSQLDFLFSMPNQASVNIEGVSFQLNHGSPWDSSFYIYPDTPIEVLEKCNSKEFDFVIVGHSHYSFSYKCKESVLINVGSIGQCREKGGIAQWAIIDTDDKSYRLINTSYDVAGLISEVEKKDPECHYIKNILIR